MIKKYRCLLLLSCLCATQVFGASAQTAYVAPETFDLSKTFAKNGVVAPMVNITPTYTSLSGSAPFSTHVDINVSGKISTSNMTFNKVLIDSAISGELWANFDDVEINANAIGSGITNIVPRYSQTVKLAGATTPNITAWGSISSVVDATNSSSDVSGGFLSLEVDGEASYADPAADASHSRQGIVVSERGHNNHWAEYLHGIYVAGQGGGNINSYLTLAGPYRRAGIDVTQLSKVGSTWAQTSTVSIGDYRYTSTGALYRYTSAGTTGTAEPVDTTGSEFADGSAKAIFLNVISGEILLNTNQSIVFDGSGTTKIFYNGSKLVLQGSPILLSSVNSEDNYISLGYVRSSVTNQSFATIQTVTHQEGDKVWCHDCRAPSQTTGAGTGRWIYKDSAGTWRTDDGLEASN